MITNNCVLGAQRQRTHGQVLGMWMLAVSLRVGESLSHERLKLAGTSVYPSAQAGSDGAGCPGPCPGGF